MPELRKKHWQRMARLYAELAFLYIKAGDFSRVDELLDAAKDAVARMREVRE